MMKQFQIRFIYNDRVLHDVFQYESEDMLLDEIKDKTAIGGYLVVKHKYITSVYNLTNLVSLSIKELKNEK